MSYKTISTRGKCFVKGNIKNGKWSATRPLSDTD